MFMVHRIKILICTDVVFLKFPTKRDLLTQNILPDIFPAKKWVYWGSVKNYSLGSASMVNQVQILTK